ncbi:hypothetical protein GX50_03494 [[Emmonsia] crescens]|uniref:Uncharacterized protein n=1 Tax=[Emmonsia] crescens TaxID=73230 RepID=A0A2B7ZLI0_9EURO|nr:hypothetical protein GX50_03494 [Emmonsia crescens]
MDGGEISLSNKWELLTDENRTQKREYRISKLRYSSQNLHRSLGAITTDLDRFLRNSERGKAQLRLFINGLLNFDYAEYIQGTSRARCMGIIATIMELAPFHFPLYDASG